MLCTSSTTCFSFLANATSDFPAVYTFGFWCCCLIVVNYCSVNTLYLAAVSVFDHHFAKKSLCQCCKPCVSHLPIVSEKAENAQGRPSCTTSFLQGAFFRFINSFRVPLVLLWLVLVVAYVSCAAQLRPDPESPKILPDSDPYMQWTEPLVEH